MATRKRRKNGEGKTDPDRKNLVLHSGAVAVGIAARQTLEGGPPSADLTYVLPEAKSAVVFALPLELSEFVV